MAQLSQILYRSVCLLCFIHRSLGQILLLKVYIDFNENQFKNCFKYFIFQKLTWNGNLKIFSWEVTENLLIAFIVFSKLLSQSQPVFDRYAFFLCYQQWNQPGLLKSNIHFLLMHNHLKVRVLLLKLTSSVTILKFYQKQIDNECYTGVRESKIWVSENYYQNFGKKQNTAWLSSWSSVLQDW